MFIRILAFSLLALVSSHAKELEVPAIAKGRIVVPQVLVTLDQEDWTYELGEKATFSVLVLAEGKPLEGAEVSYRLGPEKFEAAAKTLLLKEGKAEIEGGTMEEPGFIRCFVDFEWEGKTYSSLATAGFAPEKIQPTQVEPDDFDAFWQEQLDKLESIPLKLTKRLLPEMSTGTVNAYEVSYQSAGKWSPSRMYGILTEPKEPGKYPAVLRVPGAGIRPYGGDADLAARGVIVLEIGIHGIPVTYPKSLYESLWAGALNRYQTANLHDREDYYYWRVYLGCVQGNTVLTQHENWDGKTLVVRGGSQGGQLSIVTAALDKRVTGNVSNFPAFCDVSGYLHGRAGGWPHMFQGGKFDAPEFRETASYYDTVNFARRLAVPGCYAWGYNDVTCPPTSTFAAYNVITAPKELLLQLDMGHRGSEAFNKKARSQLFKMVGVE